MGVYLKACIFMKHKARFLVFADLRVNNMFGEDVTVTVDTQVQKQIGDKDCGVFCIAIVTSLLHNQTPGPFTQSLLRPHLTYCIENKSMIPFP